MEMTQIQVQLLRTQYSERDGHALKEQWAEELIKTPWWECAGSKRGRGWVSLGGWSSKKSSQDIILVTLDKSLLLTEAQFPHLSHSIYLVRLYKCGSCWARRCSVNIHVALPWHRPTSFFTMHLTWSLRQELYLSFSSVFFFLWYVAHTSCFIQSESSSAHNGATLALCHCHRSSLYISIWGFPSDDVWSSHLWLPTHCWGHFYKYLESDCCEDTPRVLSDSHVNQTHDLQASL